MTAHVYIHFPYCLYKCHYCDFNSYATEKKDIPDDLYTDALIREMDLRFAIHQTRGLSFIPEGTEIATVFFGGGTPSLMHPHHLEKILNALAQRFSFSRDCEITLECNPGTVDGDRFKAFKLAGVNRISLGVQSFHDKFLGAFGRIHSGRDAVEALRAARTAGYERVSADLIFGFPGQSLAEWHADLDRMIAFNPDHVSCYALTAEEGTVFTRDVRQGKISEIDDEIHSLMQEAAYERLAEFGLMAYEISNFAVPGCESRHNLAYWRYRTFVGLGAGAWSNFVCKSESGVVQVRREMNHKIPEHYFRKIREGEGFFNIETYEGRTPLKEFLMMGLRLKTGVDLSEIAILWGQDCHDLLLDVYKSQEKAGFLKRHDGFWHLTQKGYLMNNTFVSNVFDALEGFMPRTKS